MDWLMIRTSLHEHAKILRISRKLRVKTAEALGLCVILWSKAYGITRSGDLGYSPEDLDQLVGKKGLTTAMIDVGWARQNEDGNVVLTEWNKYSGAQQERQESARLRQQRHRDAKRAMSHSVTVTNSDALPSVTAQGSKVGSKKRNTIVFQKNDANIPSSFAELKLMMPEDVLALPEIETEAWYLCRSANGWTNANGRPIADWIADLRLWHLRKSGNDNHLNDVDVSQKKLGAAYVPTVDVDVH